MSKSKRKSSSKISKAFWFAEMQTDGFFDATASQIIAIQSLLQAIGRDDLTYDEFRFVVGLFMVLDNYEAPDGDQGTLMSGYISETLAFRVDNRGLGLNRFHHLSGRKTAL